MKVNKPENPSSRNSESIWGDKHVSRMVLALSCICNSNNDIQRIQIGQFCLDSNFSVLSRQSGRAFQGKGNRVCQSEGIMLRPTHKQSDTAGGFYWKCFRAVLGDVNWSQLPSCSSFGMPSGAVACVYLMDQYNTWPSADAFGGFMNSLWGGEYWEEEKNLALKWVK